jgi:hypothetical protein
MMRAPRGTATLSVANSQRLTRIAVFIVVVVTNAVVLWHFHDRYWYPVDEGVYATIAERLLAGEVLHTQIQDFHPGYGDFLNAGAFRLFGIDLLSLRYPLIAGALLQSVFVFALLHRRSALLAACAAVASVALGVIHFLNPTPHWYALFGMCALVYWLERIPRHHRMRLVGAGVLVGVITLFHQLVGVLVAAAVLAVTLDEESGSARGADTRLAQVLLLLPLVGLLVYLWRSPAMEWTGLVLFAAWPIAILVRTIRHTRTSNASAARVALSLAMGAVLSTIPLAIYCAVHGSTKETVRESLFSALSLGVRNAEAQSWYALTPLVALYQVLTPSTVADVANGLFWTVLPLLAAANGLFILTSNEGRRSLYALPTATAFYGVCSLYMQDVIYLFFSAGVSMASILWWVSRRPLPVRIASALAASGLAAVAIVFHAAQPSTRTNTEMLHGSNVLRGPWAEPLNRAHLRLYAVEQFPYASVVNFIAAKVSADARIFAVPNDAQLYFLTGRLNPFRFYNTGLGIQSDVELAAVLQTLGSQPPAVVTFRAADQYNTWSSDAIMEYVRGHYERVARFGEVEIFRKPEPQR